MTTTTATARERLAALLGEATAPGAFSTQRTAPVDDLHLEVRVDSARSAGWSWQEIADALGVSKQAVHKKYAAGRLARRLGR